MKAPVSILIAALVLLFLIPVEAQVNVKDSLQRAPIIGASYSLQIPGGDLKDRFGVNSKIGGDFMYKTKSNWLFGVDWHFIFGDQIREDTILDAIKTSKDFVIGQDGLAAEIVLYERGFLTTANVGRIFPFAQANVNSGFIAQAGIGFMQHKIRIDVSNNTAPQLTNEMKKGYDRLTNGLALKQYIGYFFLSNNRLWNFTLGFEFVQAWTANRRSYDFAAMQKLEDQRVDLQYGIRLGWMIPIYKRGSVKYYYN